MLYQCALVLCWYLCSSTDHYNDSTMCDAGFWFSCFLFFFTVLQYDLSQIPYCSAAGSVAVSMLFCSMVCDILYCIAVWCVTFYAVLQYV